MSFDTLFPEFDDPFLTSSLRQDINAPFKEENPSQFPSTFSDLNTISGFSVESAPSVSDGQLSGGSMDCSFVTPSTFSLSRTGLDGALPIPIPIQIPNIVSAPFKSDPFFSKMCDEFDNNETFFPPNIRMTPTTSEFGFHLAATPKATKRRKHSRTGEIFEPRPSLDKDTHRETAPQFDIGEQKDQMAIESAAQMEIQKLEQRRKSGTLCLGNFLFGCTADRPKTRTVRPFGRCGECLAGRTVPLVRTRMTIFPQFPKEKGQTLIPGTRDRQPVRGQRFKKVFGNWHLIVFPTVQDAEEATQLLGTINGYRAVVYTADVLPKNVWANGVPFIRSAKINKMIPKPIDTSSVVREEDIVEPDLRAHELSRNIANWQPLSRSTRSLLLKKQKQEHHEKIRPRSSAMKVEPSMSSSSNGTSNGHSNKLPGPDSKIDVIHRRKLPPMRGECDCGASRCGHEFNPNSWNVPELLPQYGPVRWIKLDDVNLPTLTPQSKYQVIFSVPGHPLTTDAMFVNSLYGKRFEFLVPVPPRHLLEPLSGPLKVVVYFSESESTTTIEMEPFTFVLPQNGIVK